MYIANDIREPMKDDTVRSSQPSVAPQPFRAAMTAKSTDIVANRSVAPRWLVGPLAPISLKQLNAKADMLQRRDNKYVVRGTVLAQALVELGRHFDVLEIDGGRTFTYETCYFDDVDHTSYFDHQRGRRIRCKVRMRKYVEAGLCFVEVKLKGKRGMTIKKRLQRPLEAHGVLDDEALEFVRASYRNLYGREFEQVLKPVIEMQYQRVTLVAKEGGERMTIDFGLKFKGRSGTRSIKDDLFVVETKSRNANGIADKILRALHQHPTSRCSKYCVAMAAMEKVQKYNRFLVAMRKLDVLPAAQVSPRRSGQRADSGPWRADMRGRFPVAAIAVALGALAVSACSPGVAEPPAANVASAASSSAISSRFTLPATSVDGVVVAELSGLAWDANEKLLYAVSDQGSLYRLRVHVVGDKLDSVEPVSAVPLVDTATGEGRPGSGKHFNAEGLALRRATDGATELVVALEEKSPAIGVFSAAGIKVGTLPVPAPAGDAVQYEKSKKGEIKYGLESVALDPKFGLLTAPEAPLPGRLDNMHTIYADGHQWSFARHVANNRLKGFDVLPDGNLLVLERSRPASKDEQVASIRRVDLATCQNGGECRTELLATLPPGAENFEGMTLLDAHHALLVSDNGGVVAEGNTFVLVELP